MPVSALILSHALDTNGQNMRFARASAKYGHSNAIRRILALGNQDPGGVVGRFQLAAEKHGGLSIRSAHRATAYFDFPTDILWTRETEAEIRRLAMLADIIHLNNSDRAYRQLRIARKPTLLHHHGTLFRRDPGYMLSTASRYGYTQAVSTIDLTRPAPDRLHWLPTAYDLAEVAAYRKPREPDGLVRIVSAPTNRAFKSTELLIAAVDGLRREGLPVELVLVEGVTWHECLRVKGTADVYFDQVILGYGCNAVEAWAMGIPVIAGADPWTLDAMARTFGQLPFYETTESGIADAIRALVMSSDLRAEYAERGLRHVRKWHAERPALERLAELYALTLKESRIKRERTSLDPVTFTSRDKQRISFDGQYVTFVDGKATVTDLALIERLRHFARNRPGYGIREVVE